jgi:hypothetical protein
MLCPSFAYELPEHNSYLFVGMRFIFHTLHIIPGRLLQFSYEFSNKPCATF